MRTQKTIATAICCFVLATSAAHALGDHPMDKTLEVRVLQTGFAGVTGTIYRIEPNGDFVARTVINGDEGDVVKSGRFDLATMSALAQSLDEARLEALPDRSEEFTGINPASIDLRYGEIARVVTLPPGQPNASACAGEAPSDLCRAVLLSETIAEVVESYEAGQ